MRVERWRVCGWFVNGAHSHAITPPKVISEVKRSVFLFDLKKNPQTKSIDGCIITLPNFYSNPDKIQEVCLDKVNIFMKSSLWIDLSLYAHV